MPILVLLAKVLELESVEPVILILFVITGLKYFSLTCPECKSYLPTQYIRDILPGTKCKACGYNLQNTYPEKDSAAN